VKLRTKLLLVFILTATGVIAGYKVVNSIFFRPQNPAFNYAPEIKKIKLYFINRDGKLQAEKREIQGGVGILEDVKICVKELAAGPKEAGLFRGLPAGVVLNGVFIDDNRCIYLDFNQNIVENQAGGTTREMQMLYSLVNTVLDNFTQVTSVRILVEGHEIKTLGGHLDITQPLRSKQLEY